MMGRHWALFDEFKAQGSCLARIDEPDLAELDFPYGLLAQGHGALLIHVQSHE